MERYRLQIQEAFDTYISELDAIYEKLYEHIMLVTEKYADADGDLILEGFWDTLKKGAHAVGSALGKGVSAAKELGKDALEAGKNFINKVSTAVKNAASAIASAPGKAWTYLVNDIWQPILKGAKELFTQAKAEGEQAVATAKTTVQNTYNTVVQSLKGAIESVGKWLTDRKDDFVKMVNSIAGQLQEGWKTAKQSGNDELAKLATWWETNWAKIKTGVGNAALISLGLVIFSIQGAYKLVKAGAQAGAEAGKGAINAMVRAWESVKKNVPEVYQAFKDGYAQGSGATAPAGQAQQTTERKVLSWEAFEKRTTNSCDDDDAIEVVDKAGKKTVVPDIKNAKKKEDKKEETKKEVKESTKIASFEEYILEKKKAKKKEEDCEEKEEKPKKQSAKQAAFFKKMGWDKKKK